MQELGALAQHDDCTEAPAVIFYNYIAIAMVPLNYNFILHAWCHAVFRVLITKVCHGIYISTRRDVVFTQDVEFTRDGNVTFS